MHSLYGSYLTQTLLENLVVQSKNSLLDELCLSNCQMLPTASLNFQSIFQKKKKIIWRTQIIKF